MNIHPSILPYFSFFSVFILSGSVVSNFFVSHSFDLNPSFFSSKSLVLVSGASMSASFILWSILTPNPKSISTSTVSPSTILLTFFNFVFVH
jgi:hypothetical protein